MRNIVELNEDDLIEDIMSHLDHPPFGIQIADIKYDNEKRKIIIEWERI